MNEAWPWLVLFGLGAFHGLNPAMGWLFAVCLGLQERRRAAVLSALPPIALGHALSAGPVVAAVGLLRQRIPPEMLEYSAAAVLLGYGVYKLLRSRHPRWVGMRVGFGDLTLWSFLMASAHGAGLMLIPVLLAPGYNTTGALMINYGTMGHAHVDPSHLPALDSPWSLAGGVGIHTLGYVVVAGLLALLVYEKFGLSILQKAWFNADFAWALALIATGAIILVM
jgi:hypothetical protein